MKSRPSSCCLRLFCIVLEGLVALIHLSFCQTAKKQFGWLKVHRVFHLFLAKRAHELLLEAKLGGVDIQICWVPAHGRVVSSWIPPPTLSEHQCRELNEMADLAAKQVMQDQLRGSPRDTWFRQCAIDKVWEVSVIHLAVAAAERYRNFVDRG